MTFESIVNENDNSNAKISNLSYTWSVEIEKSMGLILLVIN